MYADDNTDKLAGLHRQVRGIAASDLLDPEDLPIIFTALRATVDQAERDAISALRNRGASWAVIGRALNMTRQSAQQRYWQGAA